MASKRTKSNSKSDASEESNSQQDAAPLQVVRGDGEQSNSQGDGSNQGDGAKYGDVDVASRAYDRFVARGGEHGHDVEDWLAAEAELRH